VLGLIGSHFSHWLCLTAEQHFREESASLDPILCHAKDFPKIRGISEPAWILISFTIYQNLALCDAKIMQLATASFELYLAGNSKFEF
jgi:hypothetical protein